MIKIIIIIHQRPTYTAFSSLFCTFLLSACACSSEVTVTPYSPTSFVSLRGILTQTNPYTLSLCRSCCYNNCWNRRRFCSSKAGFPDGSILRHANCPNENPCRRIGCLHAAEIGKPTGQSTYFDCPVVAAAGEHFVSPSLRYTKHRF